ncbi:IS66 family insertion sequence element accessory protein TnpB [Oceanobacillus sojae]
MCGYIEYLKGIDNLTAIITSQFSSILLDESVFLFCERRTDRLNISSLMK